MFDPTIFENLKVVIEGAIYDLDLSGKILITGRVDRVDLAMMSREYRIQFRIQNGGKALAELRLFAGVADLAAEILEAKNEIPGCRIEVCFFTTVTQIETDCEQIELKLKSIWGDRPEIKQILTFEYTPHDLMDLSPDPLYHNRITLNFGRKIDENQTDDMIHLVHHMHQSARFLDKLLE